MSSRRRQTHASGRATKIILLLKDTHTQAHACILHAYTITKWIFFCFYMDDVMLYGFCHSHIPTHNMNFLLRFNWVYFKRKQDDVDDDRRQYWNVEIHHSRIDETMMMFDGGDLQKMHMNSIFGTFYANYQQQILSRHIENAFELIDKWNFFLH